MITPLFTLCSQTVERKKMTHSKLIEQWKTEESIAHIHGWDFSHIEGRYREDNALPWVYRKEILSRLQPSMRLLDIDTGGGEFLLSLGHPHENTSATEAYPPNVELCKKTLLPLGVDFRKGAATNRLPFDDASFDIIINRHGGYIPEEIFRLLKSGGLFITQQVGAENDWELVELLLGRIKPPFPKQYMEIASQRFSNAGFAVLQKQECHCSIRFFDVGALVWFARILPWEFPDFSVDACLPSLMKAQTMVERNGFIEGKTHRFLLVAQKP